MALANFFDKAALAASEVLQGFNHGSFSELLARQKVAVAFDATAAGSFEGLTTLDLSANLLARLYPSVALVPLQGGLDDVAARLAAICRAINPAIEITSSMTKASACIAVGDRRPRGRALMVFVGSDRWAVRVSAKRPVGLGVEKGNPFGAAAAACFGAANVFRSLFRNQLLRGGLDRGFTLSLLDYLPNAKAPANPALPSRLNIGAAHLVGLGAIGNGFVWTLARIEGLSGSLNAIDHERIDLTNLQRYLLATQADVDLPKVDVVARELAKSELSVDPHHGRWSDYLRNRTDWRFERVAVALDSAADRIAVQAALPKWTCNAWTQPGDLGVSRHAFLGDHACLACLYLPSGVVPNDDELVARAINMPESVREIRDFLHLNTPVGEGFVRRMATAMGVPPEPLLAFAEKPLRTFYAEAVCGGLLLKLGARGEKAATRAPLAFQSALAGVLLAAEFIADVASLKSPPPPTVTRINLLRPLGKYLTAAEAKRSSGPCICQDPDYISAYKSKYTANQA